jgi:hypothetical protein
MDPKKPLAALIVAGAKKGYESESEGGEEEVDGAEIAAEDIMQALDERDPKMLMMALKAFMDHC